MKKLLFLLFSILLILFIAACGSDNGNTTSENDENQVTEDENTGETTDKEEEKSNLGKRSNPVPVGEAVTIPATIYSESGEESANGEFTITLSNFQRGQEVIDFLLSENEFNDEPPEGHEWLMFDVNVEASIDNPDIPYFIAPTFNVIDSNGSPISQDIYPTFNTDEFGYQDIFDGGSHSGKAAVVVPTGEKVLVEYSDFDVSAFFETEK